MITRFNEALAIIEQLRSSGKRIVTTNGCFDILHLGHANFLTEAKALGDFLIVLINSDASVRGFKGGGRPVLCAEERAMILCELRPVDMVIVFEQDKPLQLLAEIKPDYHVKGGSFLDDRIAEERRLIEGCGGAFTTFPLHGNLSSTHFMAQTVANAAKAQPASPASLTEPSADEEKHERKSGSLC